MVCGPPGIVVCGPPGILVEGPPKIFVWGPPGTVVTGALLLGTIHAQIKIGDRKSIIAKKYFLMVPPMVSANRKNEGKGYMPPSNLFQGGTRMLI
jgi:hypothetical protein